MILSTPPQIEGQPIREYKGVVTGETIIGANFVKDFFANIRDIVGGRAGKVTEDESYSLGGAIKFFSFSTCCDRRRKRY